jgi:catechol 2,3-dioxygenase-like lactoylglutathione lyase family enzyme
MKIERTLAVLPVRDIDAAADWYERLLGRPADARPMPSLAEWVVTDTSTLQVFHDPANAGHTCVNLDVGSVDGAVAELRERGVTPEDVIEASAVARILPVPDPDGNTVNLLEPR